jgi:hypothetical protein
VAKKPKPCKRTAKPVEVKVVEQGHRLLGIPATAAARAMEAEGWGADIDVEEPQRSWLHQLLDSFFD